MIEFIISLSLSIFAIMNAGKSLESNLFISSVTLVLGLIFLFKLYQGQRFFLSPIATTVFKIHLLYLCLVTFSFINSTSFIESLIPWGNQIGYFSFIWLTYLLTNESTFRIRLLKTLSFTGTALGLASIYFLIRPNPSIFLIHDINFLYPVYGHNRLAEFLLIILPITAYLTTGKKTLSMYHAFFVIQVVAMLSTSSRTGIAFAALGPIVFYLFAKKQKYMVSPKIRILSTLTIVLLCISIPIWTTAQKNTQRQSTNFIQRVILKPLFIKERLDYDRFAFEKIVSNPIWGYGPGTFQYSPSNYLANTGLKTTYVHNSVFQNIYETGIFSAVFLFGIIFYIFINGYGHITRNENSFTPFILTSISLSFGHSLLDFDWQIPAIFLIIMILLTSLLPKTKSKKGPLPNKITWLPTLFSSVSLLTLIIFLRFPLLSRKFYQENILRALSNNNPQLAETIFRNWEKVDSGNGQMYFWWAGNIFQDQNYNSSAKFLIQAIKAPINNDLITQTVYLDFLGKYLDDKLSNENAVALVEAYYQASFPHDYYLLKDIPSQQTLAKSVDKLLSSIDQNQYSNRQKSILYYLKYIWELNRDQSNFEEYLSFIQKAVKYDPQNKYFQTLLRAALALTSQDSKSISMALSDLKEYLRIGNQNSEATQLLTSYLLVSQAKQNLDIEQSISLYKQALQLSPGFSSFYISLATYLKKGDLDTESQKIIEGCQRKIPNCILQYQKSLSPNDNTIRR